MSKVQPHPILVPYIAKPPPPTQEEIHEETKEQQEKQEIKWLMEGVAVDEDSDDADSEEEISTDAVLLPKIYKHIVTINTN